MGSPIRQTARRHVIRILARIVGPGWHGDQVIRSEQLDQAYEALKTVVAAQAQDPDPAHEDFYAWGWAISGAMNQLSHVCRTLQRQVAHYSDSRILLDDEGLNPAERLTQMRTELDTLARLLDQAYAVADRYHQQASHIGVEVDP
jgi:hypothetical protein